MPCAHSSKARITSSVPTGWPVGRRRTASASILRARVRPVLRARTRRVRVGVPPRASLPRLPGPRSRDGAAASRRRRCRSSCSPPSSRPARGVSSPPAWTERTSGPGCSRPWGRSSLGASPRRRRGRAPLAQRDDAGLPAVRRPRVDGRRPVRRGRNKPLTPRPSVVGFGSPIRRAVPLRIPGDLAPVGSVDGHGEDVGLPREPGLGVDDPLAVG